MARNYARLSIEDFGRHLLDSGDLDPIYIALHKTFERGTEERLKLHRWLIAYWCFYSAGFACYACEATGRDFWDVMEQAARNEEPTPFGARWPRGHERRHFRGAAAVNAVDSYRTLYGSRPEDMVERMVLAGRANITDRAPYIRVAECVKNHVLFGPWMAFKIADMLDRVLGAPVDFSEAEVFMFADPVKAALMLWRSKQGLPETAKPKDQAAAIRQVVVYLTDHFSQHLAPPLRDRPVGLQEVETILCKWKSHLNGHYPRHNDIIEIRANVDEWLICSGVAKKFLRSMPEVGT